MNDKMGKFGVCSFGVFSVFMMVYVLMVFFIVVLISMVYVNFYLNFLLSVFKCIYNYVFMYIGIDFKVIVISNSFLSRYVFSIINLLIIRVIILRVIILGGIIVRFNECKLCFKYDFDFMLNNEDVC